MTEIDARSVVHADACRNIPRVPTAIGAAAVERIAEFGPVEEAVDVQINQIVTCGRERIIRRIGAVLYISDVAGVDEFVLSPAKLPNYLT